MESLGLVSVLVIGIFISFLFLLTLRQVAPTVLIHTRKVLFDHLIVSSVVILSIGLIGYATDQEGGLYGCIGMAAILILFLIMTHPSTIRTEKEEHFANDTKNVRTRANEIIVNTIQSVQSS